MPRQIDLFNNNFQVNHNPNNRLSFSSQQVTAMQNQLPNLIAQAEQEAITKILELIDQETGLDLVGLQQWLNQLSASLSQSWLNFQNFLNGLAQETDAEVTQALAWLNNQFASINAAVAQVNTDVTDIIDSFAPGGTVTEFETGVTNLLAFFGLTPSDIGGATVIDTVWTDVITGIINPLNVIITDANAWATRLANDLLILSDVFHLTYQAGSSGDAPGHLGTNGKPTWYSAWNDLLALCGIVNSTTAPTDSAPTTGTVIQANTAAANTAGTNASTALTNAATANTLAQGTIDGLNQAWSAGGTGNPVSSVATIADAIPGSAVVGTTGAAVAFGAVGGGNSTNGTGVTSLTTSWTHTIATGDLGVLVFIAYSAGSGTNSSSVTYGGASMTLLKSMKASTGVVGAFASMDVYWLKSPPSGSQTVSVTANCSGNITSLYGNSASYSGSKVGTVGFASGGGSTSLSMSAASSTGHMVVGGFSSYVNNNNTLSSFSQTSRYNQGFTTVGLAEVFGDAAGASSVVFSATSPYSTQQWVGVTVELTN